MFVQEFGQMIINSDKIPCMRRTSTNNVAKAIIEYPPKCIEDHYFRNSEYCKDYDIFGIKMTYPTAFKDFSIDTLIPEDVLLRIYNGEILLGLFTAKECVYSFIDAIYKDLILEKKIPPKQILLVGASIDYKSRLLTVSQKYNLEPVKLEYYAELVTVTKNYYKEYYNYNNDIFPNRESSLKRDKFSKKYFCINRVWHPHRAALICLLNDRNLVDEGYLSYMDDEDWNRKLDITKTNYNAISSDIDRGSVIKNKLPLNLDYNKSVPLHFMTGYSPKLLKFYNETYFSVVTETLFDNSCPRHISEKTFKAIMYKHPFILVACYQTLEMLKLLGFKTFSGIIDESYDNEPDDSLRLIKILNEITRLCHLSDIELESFKKQALGIVEYNFNHLMTTDNIVFKMV